jgi:hypothetical protein
VHAGSAAEHGKAASVAQNGRHAAGAIQDRVTVRGCANRLEERRSAGELGSCFPEIKLQSSV